MSAGEKVTVVIVEDHELMREGLRSSLERDGHFKVVGEAGDGKLGLKLITELKPRVVVMDIGLPVLDGIEATRQVKTLLPEARVIILTSHDSDEQIFAALAAGAAGYCLKDLAGDQLKRAIKSVSDGAAWMDPRIAERVLSVFALGLGSRAGAPEKEDDIPENPLSLREIEVLRLVAEGLNNKQIAERLIIGVSTVRTHVEHILEKLAVTGRTEAAVKALREGLI